MELPWVLPPPYLEQGEALLCCAPDPLKGYCMVSISNPTYEFVQVLTQQDCIMVAFHVISPCTVYTAQEVFA